MKSEETKFGNGFEHNKDLDKQLAKMTEEELDATLLKLQAIDSEQRVKTQVLSINTSKYIVPWISPTGRAYSKWAADMLSTYPKTIRKGDKVFLHNIVMKSVMLDQDNVHHLHWLGDRHKTHPTTGDEQRDAAIWSYVYGHVTWGEMRAGKSVRLQWEGRR